jgi:hypothetical protein
MFLRDVVVVTVITINYPSTKAICYTIYLLISDPYSDHIDHIAVVHLTKAIMRPKTFTSVHVLARPPLIDHKQWTLEELGNRVHTANSK